MGKQITVITGNLGSGKTTLVKELIKEYQTNFSQNKVFSCGSLTSERRKIHTLEDYEIKDFDITKQQDFLLVVDGVMPTKALYKLIEKISRYEGNQTINLIYTNHQELKKMNHLPNLQKNTIEHINLDE